MKLEVPLVVLYGLALAVGVAFVVLGKLEADAVWGVVVGLLAPAPFYKSPVTIPVFEDRPSEPATPEAIRKSRP